MACIKCLSVAKQEELELTTLLLPATPPQKDWPIGWLDNRLSAKFGSPFTIVALHLCTLPKNGSKKRSTKQEQRRLYKSSRLARSLCRPLNRRLPRFLLLP